MKRVFIVLLFLVMACPARATSYFMSTSGSDSNNGLSTGAPWLSPNHSLNCGDTITAASGTYSSANFGYGKWGTVTCSGGNNVAWLICATFDTCKINAGNSNGMIVDTNYWGVQGWEITNTSGSYACFEFVPPNSSTSIHHVIFANNIANSCGSGGFSSFADGSAGTDYVVYIGNIAYNTTTSGSVCPSAFNIYEPKASDTVSGTHMYVAGNFGWATVNADPCAGTAPTDGEGLTFDTFDGSQGGGNDYAQQAVAYNNIFVGNGGRCYQTTNNASGSNHSPMYIEYNTCYGNETDSNQRPGGSVGELRIVSGYSNTWSNNLIQTTASTVYGGQTLYGAYVATGNGTDTVSGNWIYTASGNNCGVQAPANGFACGTNTTGTSPSFSNPTIPGAPSCGSTSSVPACMTTLISNFTATASGANVYGYQIPLSYSITDPLFPAWLCNVTLPTGLVTRGCGSSPTSSGTTIANKSTIGVNSTVK